MGTITIGDSCEVLNGYAFKSEKYTSSGIRVIRIANVQKGYIEDDSPVFYQTDDVDLNKYMLRENDLLVSLTGNVGRTALLTKDMLPAALNQRVACLRLKTNKITRGFLFHLLNSDYFESKCIQSSQGVAQKNLSTEWLKSYDLPLYSLSKQNEITKILDNVRNTTILKEQEIQKYDELIKARFIEMFGDPQINKKGFTKAPMGEYLSLLTDFSSNGSYKTLDSGVVMYDEPNYAWMVRTTDLESGDKSSIKYIDENAYELLSKSKIFGGEIIMNKIGSAGKIYIIPKLTMPASLGRNAFMFRYDERINNIFMYYLLTSDYGQREIQQYVRGAVTKTITKDDARAVLIIVPPLELQQRFADFVKQVDKSREAVKKSLEKTQQLYDSLMQEYFG